MIKSELVARLTARYPHLYHRDVERIVTTMLDAITKALAQGHRVELRGFGAFSVKVRPSRMGRNRRTGFCGREARALFPHGQGIARKAEWRYAQIASAGKSAQNAKRFSLRPRIREKRESESRF